jgi:uncharacterized protein (TIGR00251 family)
MEPAAPPPATSSLSRVVVASGDGVVVNVRVQPRAGRPGVAGLHGDAVRIRVKAPPADGRANDEVTVLLARALDVAPRAVTLVTGATSRVKRFSVTGLEAGLARERLGRALEHGRA